MMKKKKYLWLMGLAVTLLMAFGCSQEQQPSAAPDAVSDPAQPITSRFDVKDATGGSDFPSSDIPKYDHHKTSATVSFEPISVPTAGKVSPAFGPPVHVWTSEYDAFGVHFSRGTPGPDTPTAIFDDPPLAWGGVNAAGSVDILAPVDGAIVVPGTGGMPGQTQLLTIEAGFAAVGALLLEVWDCHGNLIGSTINNGGIGPNGRRLMTLAMPIAAFRVSTPAGDTFGVDSIMMDPPTPCP